MGNRSFFNALHDREGDFLLATVLEGPAQGERVLLRNTAPVWPEDLPAFWEKHLPALAAVTSSGILKSAGQRIFVECFGAAPQLVVCGGGHVARRWCGWQSCWACRSQRWRTAPSLRRSCVRPGPMLCSACLCRGSCADPRRAGDILCGRDPCPQL